MWRHAVAAFAALLTLLAGGVALRAPAWPTAFVAPEPALGCIGRSVFEFKIFHVGRRLAHAISAVALRDGRMRAVWYEGTNELNTDVRLWTAIYDGAQWSKPRIILEPQDASAGSGRFVRKLGNPLLYRDSTGDLVLLFAGNVVGGWDSVSLKLTRSSDEGDTWSPPRNLTTSPVFNFGTGIRGPAIATEDGRMMIPVSREFVRSFSEIIVLDQRGQVVDKRRIGTGIQTIQPFVSVRDSQRAIAIMRPQRKYAVLSTTTDAANHWSNLIETTLDTFNTPVAAARIVDDLFVVSTAYEPPSSAFLRFSILRETSQTWRHFHSRRFEPMRATPRYPQLMAGPDGLYHLLFTLKKEDGSSELLHGRISRDWIAAQGGLPCP